MTTADEAKPAAMDASAVPSSRSARAYPEPFASRVAGRTRKAPGDVFGLTHFGVNPTRLPPSGMSALRHTDPREPARRRPVVLQDRRGTGTPRGCGGI